MIESQADVDDRHIVRSIVGHDDLPSIGCPGDRERACLAVGVVCADADTRHLSVRRSHAGAVDIDDRDRVPFEVDVGSLAGGNGDESSVGAGFDPKRPGLDSNARRHFHDRDARQGFLEIHHRHVIGARVP